MDERAFLILADAELGRIEAALAHVLDTQSPDWDLETKPGGILEIEFADDSKIIINRHAAAREIWIAARSGGYHFAPPVQPEQAWRDTRSGESLLSVLARCVSEQAGATVTLAR